MGTGISIGSSSSSSRKQELETNQEEKGEHFKALLIHTLQKKLGMKDFLTFLRHIIIIIDC